MNYYIKTSDRKFCLSRKEYFLFQDRYPFFVQYEREDEDCKGLCIDLTFVPKFPRLKWCIHHISDTLSCTCMGLALVGILYLLFELLLRGFCSYFQVKS